MAMMKPKIVLIIAFPIKILTITAHSNHKPINKTHPICLSFFPFPVPKREVDKNTKRGTANTHVFRLKVLRKPKSIEMGIAAPR